MSDNRNGLAIFETMTALQASYIELWNRTMQQSVESMTQQAQVSFELMTEQTLQSMMLVRRSQESLTAILSPMLTKAMKYPETRAN